MIICNNPYMKEHGFPAKCARGKIDCCRHCEDATKCLMFYTPDDGTLCPYIGCPDDLKNDCPFEKECE